MINKTLNELVQEIIQLPNNQILSIVDTNHLFGIIQSSINKILDENIGDELVLECLARIGYACQKFAEDHELVKKQENITPEKFQFDKQKELDSCKYLLREFISLDKEVKQPDFQLGSAKRVESKYKILIERTESLLNNE